MVKWMATTSTGHTFEGLVDDGSWLDLKGTYFLGSHQDIFGHIVSLRLDGEKGSATIDDNRDGYFIGNKIIAAVQGGEQIELVGIGYWSNSDNTARVKWYNKETMELQFPEARPLETSEFFLIRK